MADFALFADFNVGIVIKTTFFHKSYELKLVGSIFGHFLNTTAENSFSLEHVHSFCGCPNIRVQYIRGTSGMSVSLY